MSGKEPVSLDSDGEKRKSTRRWLKGKGFNAMVWVWVWVLDVKYQRLVICNVER